MQTMAFTAVNNPSKYTFSGKKKITVVLKVIITGGRYLKTRCSGLYHRVKVRNLTAIRWKPPETLYSF